MKSLKERSANIIRCEEALRQVFDLLYPGGKGEKMFDEMLFKYGSAGALIEAGQHLLMTDGMRSSDALLISMLPDIVRHVERAKYTAHPYLRTLNEIEPFMRYRYLGETIEKFDMVTLDARGRLIELVHLQSGTEDSAPFYLRHVMNAMVRTGAKAIVLFHNHPNLSARPSPDDLMCTRRLMNALRILEIPLLDHIIMLGKEALSIRGFGYIPEREWLIQNPGHKHLRGWLKDWDMEAKAEILGKIDRG